MRRTPSDLVYSLLMDATRDNLRRLPGGYVLAAQLVEDATLLASPDAVWNGLADLLAVGIIEPGRVCGRPAYRFRRRRYRARADGS